MRDRRFLIIGLIISFVVSLAACGGGGGGGGFTPITYSGSSTLATIDDTNASAFAGLAENGATTTTDLPLPMSVSVSSSGGTVIPIPVVDSVVDLAKILPSYIDESSVAGSSAARVTQTATQGCGPDPNFPDPDYGTMTISMSINEVTLDVSATITYSDCDMGTGVVMNGGMTMAMNLNDDPYFAPSTMNIVLRNLKMDFQGSTQSITTYAVISMTEDLTGVDPVYNIIISDMITLDHETELSARIRNYDIAVIEYPTYDEISIASASVKARIYDHLLGYVEFYTVTPIKEDPVTGPFEGIIRMEGFDGSWAEIDFSNDCSVTDTGTFFDGVTVTGTTGDGRDYTGTFCYVSAP